MRGHFRLAHIFILQSFPAAHSGVPAPSHYGVALDYQGAAPFALF